MNRLKIFFGLVLITGLMSCSRSLVKSDYDREINFVNFKTYSWMGQPKYTGTNGIALNTLFEKRLKNAVEEELKAKGFQKKTDDNPDFLIDYTVKVVDKVDLTSNGYDYYPGYYGFGYWPGYNRFGFRSRYYGFGYGSSFYGAGGLDVYQYKEGTLILDFIDPESKELIWRGLYSDEIDRSGIISEEKINKAVKEILKQFPPENSKTSNVVA